MTDVTFADVQREVRRLAAENPDFIYAPAPGRTCNYVRPNGEGGWEGDCLWGQAFIECGITPVELLPFGEVRIGAAFDRLGIAAAEGEIGWARIAQRTQDCSGTWGDAIKLADAQFPLNEAEERDGAH